MGDDPATGGSRGILLIQQLAALGNCHEKIPSRVDKADSRTAQIKVSSVLTEISNKLLGQGYVKERLKSSLRKFYGRYGDLTKQYEVPVSRMLHDILDDDHIQWHPPLIGHYTNFWPLLIWTLLPNLTFYLIVQGFHRTYATGAACQQRTLTPPDTWSFPTLGLACVLMSRPISPELVLSPDFWISNTPRYFSFAYHWALVCEFFVVWQLTLTLPGKDYLLSDAVLVTSVEKLISDIVTGWNKFLPRHKFAWGHLSVWLVRPCISSTLDVLEGK